MIDRYKKQRLDKGAAKATVNRELATLSHLFGMAVEWRWINRRPGKIVKYDEGPGRIIALDDEQSDRLLSAALCSSTLLCWLFAVYALNTTMRHGEIIASRFDQIDFARRRQCIPDTKAGEREQPLTLELVQVLERERSMRDDGTGWIFPSPHSDSTKGHRANMDRPFKDAVVRAGLNQRT
jgi:integrase